MNATPLLVTAEYAGSTFVDVLLPEHNTIKLPFSRYGPTVKIDPIGEAEPADFRYTSDQDLQDIAYRAIMSNDRQMMRSLCYQVLYRRGTFPS